MANSGLKHVVASVPVPRSAYESEEHHALVSGTSFPASPVEKQLFYRTDLHQLYIYNGTSWVDCTSQGITVHNTLTGRDAADSHPLAAVTGLADHSARHELAGADVLSLAGLSGEPAELTTHKTLTTGVHGVGTKYVAKTAQSDQEPHPADIGEWNKQAFTNLLTNGDYEIGDPPTGWILTQGGTTSSFSRSTTQVKTGSYSAKLINELNQWAFIHQSDIPSPAYYRNRKVTLGAWLWVNTPNRVRVSIYDGVGETASSYHTGDSTWQWITVTRLIAATATTLDAFSLVITSGAVITAYGDGAICVEGEVCPAFSPLWGGERQSLLVNPDKKITFNPTVADIDCILPAVTARGNVGNATYKFNLVRATTITSGDICFEERNCSSCNKPFTVGEKITLVVRNVVADSLATEIEKVIENKGNITEKIKTVPALGFTSTVPICQSCYLGDLVKKIDDLKAKVEELGKKVK
jgi:hypothetical protein